MRWRFRRPRQAVKSFWKRVSEEPGISYMGRVFESGGDVCVAKGIPKSGPSAQSDAQTQTNKLARSGDEDSIS